MRIKSSTPLWLASRALLFERGDAFFAQLKRSEKDCGTEAIHDLRVASRRVREALTLFSPCYPQEALRPLRRKFSRVTKSLGDLRNADEAFFFLRRLAERLGSPGREFLAAPLARCASRRIEERKRLRPALDKWRNGSLARRFYRHAGHPVLFGEAADHPAFVSMTEFARGALDLKGSAIPHLLLTALREEEVDDQHRLRIAVKHLRYRAEILSPLFGSSFLSIHGTLKNYQEELGKMHDLDVFAALLAAEEDSGPGREATLAAISGERHKHFERFVALHGEMPLTEVAEGLRGSIQ